MQENLIKNAVQFLKNPKVAGTDKEKLITFLKGKGLSDEDIKEAFKRVSAEPQPAAPTPLDLVTSPTKPVNVQILNSTVQQSHSNLSTFPDPRFLTSCKTLLLSHNQLSAIPAEINLLTNLENLDLSSNTLTSEGLPLPFFSLFHLKSLNLSFNNLKSLEHFHRLSNLERLNVSHNAITEIPQDFVNLQKLSIFIVNKNQIKTLPKAIVLMNSLEKIVLFDNPVHADVVKAAYESVSTLKSLLLTI